MCPIARICQRVRLAWILLGLHDQPSAIAVVRQATQQRRIVDASVTGHGEDAVQHGVHEAGVVGQRHSSSTSRRASLQCTCTTRAMCRSQQRRGIAAGEQAVARIIQQPCCLTGRRHEPIDFVIRLHDRAHVMVERHADAERRHALGQRGDFASVVAAIPHRPARDVATPAGRCRHAVRATYRHRRQPCSRDRAAESNAARSRQIPASTSRSQIRPSYQPDISFSPCRCRIGPSSRTSAREFPPSSVPL